MIESEKQLHYDGGGGEEREKPYREAQVIAMVEQVTRLGLDWVDRKLGKSPSRWDKKIKASQKRVTVFPRGVDSSRADRSIAFLWGRGEREDTSSLWLTDRSLKIEGCGNCHTFKIDVSGNSVRVFPEGRQASITDVGKGRVIKGLLDFLLMDGFQREFQKQEADYWCPFLSPEEFEGKLFDSTADALHEKRNKDAFASDRKKYQAALKRWLPGVSVSWDRESWGELLLIALGGQKSTISRRFDFEKGTRRRTLNLGEELGLVLAPDQRGRFWVEGLMEFLKGGWVVAYNLTGGGVSLEMVNERIGETILTIERTAGDLYKISADNKLFVGGFEIGCSQEELAIEPIRVSGLEVVREENSALIEVECEGGLDFLSLKTRIDVALSSGFLNLAINSSHEIFNDQAVRLDGIEVILPSEGFPSPAEILEAAIFNPDGLRNLGSISIS